MPEEEERDLPARSDAEEVTGEVQGESRTRSDAVEVKLIEYRHSGPLPSTSWFEGVERLHPGATELILTDYREQREHERAMQRESVALDRDSFNAFARYQTRQLLIAGGLALLWSAAGIVLVALGYSLAGLVLLLVEITALVAVFLNRQRGTREQPEQPPEADEE